MDAPHFVIYRAPLPTRIAGWVGLVFLASVFVCLGVFSFSLINQTVPPNGPRTWRYCVAPVAFFVGAALSACLMCRSHKTRLLLSAEVVSIGNSLLNRRIRYDDVRVIEMEEPERRRSRTRRLRIQPVHGRSAFMDLPAADAEECFHALRELCPTIPAIGPGATIYSTADPAFTAAGRATLAAEYQRKSNRAFVGAIICAVLGIGAITTLTFVAAARLHPKFWLGAVFLPIAAIALHRASRVFRHNAAHMEAMIDQTVDETV
jgi:hypothetical protein